MTREEAIAYGNDYYIDLISACCKIDEKHKEFVRMSLEALEQESIDYKAQYESFSKKAEIVISQLRADRDRLLETIDKIRAEMFEEMLSHSGTGEEAIQAYADGLKKGLNIIDKNKAESENI